MDAPSQNHSFPIYHNVCECELLKQFITKPPSKKAKPEEVVKAAKQEALADDFSEPTGCPMIFGGSRAYGGKHRLKVVHNPTIP